MLYVKNLHKSYQVGTSTYEVLKGINLAVSKGEFVAIMGPSGSGKSTLLNCISCYIPFEEGEILLGGQSLAGLNQTQLAKVRNEKLGFVFQDFMLLDGLSMRENILLPCIIKGNADAKAETQVRDLCEMFGISHIMDKYPAEISGGERQRTAVARALINRPLLVLADEPTGNLDSKSSRAVIDAFISSRDTLSATIFMVTHDSFSASFCDRVILMKDGKIWRTMVKDSSGDKMQARSDFQDRLLSATKEMSSDVGTAVAKKEVTR